MRLRLQVQRGGFLLIFSSVGIAATQFAAAADQVVSLTDDEQKELEQLHRVCASNLLPSAQETCKAYNEGDLQLAHQSAISCLREVQPDEGDIHRESYSACEMLIHGLFVRKLQVTMVTSGTIDVRVTAANQPVTLEGDSPDGTVLPPGLERKVQVEMVSGDVRAAFELEAQYPPDGPTRLVVTPTFLPPPPPPPMLEPPPRSPWLIWGPPVLLATASAGLAGYWLHERDKAKDTLEEYERCQTPEQCTAQSSTLEAAEDAAARSNVAGAASLALLGVGGAYLLVSLTF